MPEKPSFSMLPEIEKIKNRYCKTDSKRFDERFGSSVIALDDDAKSWQN
jgi:hypothetical protein